MSTTTSAKAATTKKVKTVLTASDYYNLMDMFNSPDEANHTVAFGILNNLDFDTNVVYILMARKYSLLDKSVWEKNCPALEKKIVSCIEDNEHEIITYMTIMSQLVMKKPDTDQVVVFSKEFNKYFVESFNKVYADQNVEFKLDYTLNVEKKEKK